MKLLGIGLTFLVPIVAFAEPNWPNWRGPNGDGIVNDGNPPITWSETENIKWKIPIPGDSDSTPVIWGDRIFIQTAVATAEEPATGNRRARGSLGGTVPTVPWAFKLLCLDRETGELIWERTAIEAIPHQGHHPHGSFSAYSPVTDGNLIWVSFGSQGIYCYDFDGNQKWQDELPKLDIANSFGEASSPCIAGDAIIVVADHEGQSKIFAFDKATGAVRWEKDRDEGTTWATPLPVEVNGKLQVITSGIDSVRAYDVETGEVVWHCSGLTEAAIPTPITGHGMVYVATGYMGYAMMAINLGGTGDLNKTDSIAWQLDRGTPYVNSPLLYGDIIYSIEGVQPKVSAFRAQNGEVLFDRERVTAMKMVYGSPIGVANRIYMADRHGTAVVLKHGPEFEVLATNKLDEGFDASPVVVGDTLFLKGEKHLYCIEESP